MKFNQISLTLTLVLAVGCGHSSPKPPEPCRLGVNAAPCTTGITQRSNWTHALTTELGDPKTKAAIPGSARTLTVGYEFTPDGDAAKWRRSVLVESAKGHLAMYEEGHVLGIDGQTLRLKLERSTCASAPTEAAGGETIVLFYARHDGILQLDTTPVEVPQYHGLADAVVGSFGRMLTETLRTGIESVFTLGSARAYLRSGHGQFNLVAQGSDDFLREKSADIGCFNAFGEGFDPSSK